MVYLLRRSYCHLIPLKYFALMLLLWLYQNSKPDFPYILGKLINVYRSLTFLTTGKWETKNYFNKLKVFKYSAKSSLQLILRQSYLLKWVAQDEIYSQIVQVTRYCSHSNNQHNSRLLAKHNDFLLSLKIMTFWQVKFFLVMILVCSQWQNTF